MSARYDVEGDLIKAFDAAWDDRAFKCRKAPAPKKLEFGRCTMPWCLRCLVAEGRVVPSLVHCVPTVPQWRLSSLPRYLEASDVERVIASCDVSTKEGLRDRAILLLLARLGLRAGDIVAMKVDDVDWPGSSLRVCGQGRRETLLPLPSDEAA